MLGNRDRARNPCRGRLRSIERPLQSRLKLKIERGEGVPEADVPALRREIENKLHTVVKVPPAMTWLEPNTLERAVKKTQLLEKQYEQ